MSRPNGAQVTGLGVGWRPEIAGVLADLPGLRFTEVIAESVRCDGRVPPSLAELRARGVTVVPHGTRLSLGSAEPPDPHRVRHLASVAAAMSAPLVSEHVAFVRAGGLEAGHLLPLPRSRAALRVLTRNVRAVTAELDVPLALEPIAALFDWPDDELGEAEFVTELLERTDTWLLLDVANVYANCHNRGTDPLALLDRLPLERVAYVHVAGGELDGGGEYAGLYHDTHTATTPEPVLALLRGLRARLARFDGPPAVLLERDGRYPPSAELRAELDAIAEAAELPTITQRPPPAAPPAHPAPAARPAPPAHPVPFAHPAPSDYPAPSEGSRAGHRRRGHAADPVAVSKPTLAGRQVELVAALVTGGPPPAGFDRRLLRAAEHAVLTKRAGAVAATWPGLATALGQRWPVLFRRWAAGRPSRGPLRDGWDLARELEGADRLPPLARTELALREAALRFDGRHAPRRRRLPHLRRAPGGVVVGFLGRVHLVCRR